MEDDEKSFLSERSPSEDFLKRLIREQSTLTDLLRSIESDARLMDASLEDAHDVAVRICQFVKRDVFGPDSSLDPFAYWDYYNNFELARLDENDIHEVYADDLERHRKRQRKDLGVAESDSDKFAVVKRRRGYISTLVALHSQVSSILELVGTRDGSAGRPPEDSAAGSGEMRGHVCPESRRPPG